MDALLEAFTVLEQALNDVSDISSVSSEPETARDIDETEDGEKERAGNGSCAHCSGLSALAVAAPKKTKPHDKGVGKKEDVSDNDKDNQSDNKTLDINAPETPTSAIKIAQSSVSTGEHPHQTRTQHENTQ